IAASSGVNLAATGVTFDISTAGNQTIQDLSGIGGTVAIGTNSLTFGTGNATSFGGTFTGSGGLDKTGAGTFTLTGDSSGFTGTTTIGAGTLAVGTDATPNAALGGNVVVQGGGTLIGHGSIGSLSNIGGTVAPGGSIGTLTINGNYAQAGAGALRIEVSPTAASQLLVRGSASLAGALALVFDPGIYTARNYTIVSAAKVSGTFATVTGTNPSGLAQLVVIDPADVQLQLSNPAPAPTPAPGGPTPTPTPIPAPAPAPAPTPIPVPTPIVIVPTNDTIYTAASSIAVLNGQRANGIILDRLGNRQAGIADGPTANGRAADGALAAAAAPVQYAQAGNAAPLGAIASALPAATEGAWFRGIGGFASVNGSATAPGFTGTAGGFLAGFDRPVAPDFYLGIAGGYLRSTVDEHSTSHGSIDTARVALYGGGWWDGNLFTATAGYARDWFDTARGLALGTASENHGADEATVAGQWSRPLEVQGLGGGLARVTPKAGFQFLHLAEGSFAESGASGFNLAVGSRGTDSFQPYIGIATSQKFVTDGGTEFTPELRLGYAREALGNSRAMTVTTASGFDFPVTGVAPSRDIVTAGIGVTVRSGPALSYYANYDTALRSGNTTDTTVSAGLHLQF
ncbi:MAG TPA: autotransporter domain-containing protein, partial [Stellaceae bacterium]|nr:autotransporter domain-containing protein [Stellaceae bacterium]